MQTVPKKVNIHAVSAVAGSSSAAFRLEGLVVHPRTGRVVGPGSEVRLEPRLMAVLEVLARTPGELVTRHELLSSVWPGGEVYDEALTQCVYQLRQQLLSAGGDDEYRNLISTVPKRGYILKGRVEDNAEASRDQEVVAGVEPNGAAGATAARRRLIFAVLGLVMALAALWAIVQWRSPAEPVPGEFRAKTLAVLPFLPLAAEDRDAVLELGMADTLIARLSGIRQLVIRPISSVRRYADIERDALGAGRELDADVVVEGSIQRSGQDLRVTVRLLRVDDGSALWADTFHENAASIFAVQDAICERIAAALVPALGQQAPLKPARLGTTDAEAYEHYLEGRYVLARFTPSDMRSSMDHFRQAVTRDPNYAQAWLGLANVQFRLPIAGEAPPGEYYPHAKAAAQNALEIDQTLAEGHAMLGWIAHWYDWDWSASEAHFRRAIELNPNDTEGRLGYGHLLMITGRHERALAEVRRAREISPFYPVAASLEGFFLARTGRPEEAIQRLEDARQQYPDFWLIRLHLAEANFSAGRYENALEEAQAARAISGGSTVAMAREVAYLARLGRTAEAEAVLDEMLQQSAERYVPPFDLAVACDGVGDADAALRWLERAHELRDPKIALLGVYDWNLVHERPEFIDLLHRLDLAE